MTSPTLLEMAASERKEKEVRQSTSLKKYHADLTAHDWDFNYSDDPGFWQRGFAMQRNLEERSHLSDAHLQMYRSFWNHYKAREAKANGRAVIVPPLPFAPDEIDHDKTIEREAAE